MTFVIISLSQQNLTIEELCWDIRTFGNFIYKRSWLNLSNSSCQIRVDKVQLYCGRLQLLGFLTELNHLAKALRSFFTFLVIPHLLGNCLAHLRIYCYQLHCTCHNWMHWQATAVALQKWLVPTWALSLSQVDPASVPTYTYIRAIKTHSYTNKTSSWVCLATVLTSLLSCHFCSLFIYFRINPLCA